VRAWDKSGDGQLTLCEFTQQLAKIFADCPKDVWTCQIEPLATTAFHRMASGGRRDSREGPVAILPNAQLSVRELEVWLREPPPPSPKGMRPSVVTPKRLPPMRRLAGTSMGASPRPGMVSKWGHVSRHGTYDLEEALRLARSRQASRGTLARPPPRINIDSLLSNHASFWSLPAGLHGQHVGQVRSTWLLPPLASSAGSRTARF
jgi:hypothetical protein